MDWTGAPSEAPPPSERWVGPLSCLDGREAVDDSVNGRGGVRVFGAGRQRDARVAAELPGLLLVCEPVRDIQNLVTRTHSSPFAPTGTGTTSLSRGDFVNPSRRWSGRHLRRPWRGASVNVEHCT